MASGTAARGWPGGVAAAVLAACLVALSAAAAAAAAAAASAPSRAGAMPRPAVVVLTYDRVDYLERTLRSLASLSGVDRFAVHVSHDGGGGGGVAEAAARHGFALLTRERVPRLGPKQGGTAYLAQHYRDALDRIFVTGAVNHSHAVVCEDDMVFAPDFLELFEAAAPLLEADPTLWCVSSWNDFGFSDLVADERRMFRTDYFPGLGWMLRRELWLELRERFPADHWDHWMRTDDASRGRECVVPEVSRNFNIGERGTNTRDGVYSRYLCRTALSRGRPDLRPLEYLEAGAYERQMRALFASAPHAGEAGEPRVARLLAQPPPGRAHLVTYTAETYGAVAAALRVWNVPRTTHRGAIIVKWRGAVVLLADRRTCPYLPDELRERRDDALRVLPGALGQSCSAACAAASMRCDAAHMPFLNTCTELRLHFPCEGGCHGGVAGPDLPNYVLAPQKPEYHRACLTTEKPGGCAGSHWSSRRLCPCMPR